MTKDFKGVITPANNQHGVSWMLGGIAVGLLAGLAIFSLFSNQNAVAQATPTTTPEAPAATTTVAASSNVTTTTANAETVETVVKQAQADTPAEQAKQKPVFSYHAMLPQIDMESSYKAPNINRNPATKAELAEERRAAAKEKKEAEKIAAAQKQMQEKQLQQVAAQQAQIVPEPVIQQATIKGRGVALQLGAYSSVTQAQRLQQQMSQRGMNTRIEQGTSKGAPIYRVRIGPSADMNIVNQWRRAAASMGIQPMNIPM